ncbi:MAG: hypothetical protein M5T52_07580 [Ignavibacteriaceae bacterium]|nr:hypothetical protein [Ignavibacteriaceae bacterium]
MDIVNLKIKGPNELFRIPSFQLIEKGQGKKKNLYHLKHILKVGQRVLLWNENPDELRDLEKTEILKGSIKFTSSMKLLPQLHIFI